MNGPPRILIIDDDPLFRSLLVSLLRDEYVVTAARDGAEGFYKAVETPPDVAIIDVRMPGWGGLRTLRALRQHHSTSRCRVMMLTSDASVETLAAAMHDGANDYLVKANLTGPQLQRKVADLLAAKVPGTVRVQVHGAPVTIGAEESADTDDAESLEWFENWD